MTSSAKVRRDLTVDMFVSLDGFAAGADGTQNCFRPYFGPQSGNFVQSVLDEPQVMIVGQVTYQVLSKFWRSATGASAARMNALPKVVFSNTLKEPLDWQNSRLSKRKLADELSALKNEPGDPLRSVGSINLVKQIMQLGLVDRLRLLVFPVVLGSNGKEPLFAGWEEATLTLVDTTFFDSKVVKLEYRT